MTQEERKQVALLLRRETGCGMMLITKCLDKLVDMLKMRPHPPMDVGVRLNMEWEEYPIRKITNDKSENTEQ